MTTIRTKPKSKLGILLQSFRCDRPSEWQMDEYTNLAEDMQHQHDQLTAINQELVKALDHVINKRVSNLTLREYSDLIKRAKELTNEG